MRTSIIALAFFFGTIASLFLISGALGEHDENVYRLEFTRWMHQHKKSYSHKEFKDRYEIFKKNFEFVMSHDPTVHGFSVELNHLADLTVEEFAHSHLGYKHPRQRKESGVLRIGENDLPASVDWRQHKAVTPVKNQGNCGSCWSFSTTGAIEGVHALKTGSLVSLSEQNLIDCSELYGNMGCNGGTMDGAFQYVMGNGGIDTESSYPYTSGDGSGPGNCNYNSANSGATISAFHDVASGSESELQKAVSLNPVSVAIDASRPSFQLYKDGVYYSTDCSSSQLDHGVLAVGYGTDQGKDYWLVKNSWGPTWGLNGYIMMSRNKNNNCGIATSASFPCVDSCPSTL